MNLSGNCKTYVPLCFLTLRSYVFKLCRACSPINDNSATFPADAEIITFVGRPFPLDEAPQHLARLSRSGLTFGDLSSLAPPPSRLTHATLSFADSRLSKSVSSSPGRPWNTMDRTSSGLLLPSPVHLTVNSRHLRGIYDTSYISYLRSVLSLLPQFGLTAFVALHQDVWSRYAGGSGAPAWTLEHTDFDLYGLEESGASWLRGECGGGHSEEGRGLWPCGYQKFAAAIMAYVFVVAVTKGALQ